MSELTNAAAKVADETHRVLSLPTAKLLPADARQLIRELARVVYLLAVEVEKCVPGIPSK